VSEIREDSLPLNRHVPVFNASSGQIGVELDTKRLDVGHRGPDPAAHQIISGQICGKPPVSGMPTFHQISPL
jgi:hypothetical protein